MDLPHAPYLFMLAVGEFVEVQDQWNDIEVNYYVEPAYAPYASAIFGHTPEMLDFFSQKLDYPYPWPKYSQIVVRDYIAGAMENTSATVFSDVLQVNDRQLLDEDYDDLIAHELFHHWFGNLVTCESWSQLPLNESFACLGAHIWRAHKYGNDAGDLSIWTTHQDYLRAATYKQVPLIRFYYDSVGEVFDAHSYHKGALVLHMLRKYVGEEIFFKALSHYLKKHAFSAVEIHQLRKAFEEVTGEDLNWFFNQWFFDTGHPILKAEHSYDNGVLTLKIWQKQNVQTTRLYKLPLVVDIWIAGKKQAHKIVVEQQYHEFTWMLAQQPALVHIDSNNLLTGIIEYPKSAAEYQRLYYQGESFFAKHEALQYCINNKHSPACCKVVQDALQDHFWFFRKMAAEAFKYYQSEDLTIIAALLALSRNDCKPAVSAAAISTLASLQNPAQYMDTYKQGMAAASYHLASTALYAYATTTQEPGKEQLLANFEASDHLKIITALANYYIKTQQSRKYQWLKEKLTRLQGSIAYNRLIVTLGTYLAVIADTKIQKNGLGVLKKIYTSTDSVAIQAAVREALQKMRKIKSARALLNELKTNE